MVIDRLIDSFPSVIPDINGYGMGRFDPIHGIVISVFCESVIISRSILSFPFPSPFSNRIYRGNRLTPNRSIRNFVRRLSRDPLEISLGREQEIVVEVSRLRPVTKRFDESNVSEANSPRLQEASETSRLISHRTDICRERSRSIDRN